MVENERLIELKNISKEFDGTTVLDNINLYIRKKEFVTLLGPSGCGKTTTLRIIGGFETPDHRRGAVSKGVTSRRCRPTSASVNTVFQKYALFPHLNVFDNIAFGLKLKKVSKAEITRRVEYMLELVNLKGYEQAPCGRALRRSAAACGHCPCAGERAGGAAAGRAAGSA